ncbi:MAG: Asp23/Gls24 family envelope stress response protein [Bacillota bacterium]
MEVFALVGPSGTGKSHRAIMVAHDHHIDVIIDDGLVIQGSRILAGSSAKRQSTKIGAIRTALFTDTDHVEETRQELKKLAPEKVLILATSDAMAQRIAKRLEMPPPGNYIPIEAVATPREIERARYIRKKHGRHVIPAPTVEVKRRFSGTIIDPLQTLFRRQGYSPQNPERHLWVEQSVVRPTFTFFGRFYIANHVLTSIVSHVSSKISGILRVYPITVETKPEGVSINVEVTVEYGQTLRPLIREMQEKIVHWVEYTTSLHVLAVNVTIRHLSVKGLETVENV